MHASTKLSLAALLAVSLPVSAQDKVDQVTGVPVPELAGVDQVVIDYMEDNGIPAGVVGIIRQGRIVYQRGFDTPENTALRTASVEKPFMAAAVERLIDEGTLDRDAFVFDLGQLPVSGILDLPPHGGQLGTEELKTVTVDHLLEHKGGWDREISWDPMFNEVDIAAALGVASPPSREETTIYMLSRPLQHTPGSTYSYSNFGYMLLGLIVRELTGMEPIQFLTSRTVTAEDWVPATEVIWGRSLKPGRSYRERGYKYTSKSVNVFDPGGDLVPRPDGGFHLEGMQGHGNLVMSTTPILRFLDRYHVAGDEIGRDHLGVPENYQFLGLLHGSSACAMQRDDDVHIAVIYNHSSFTREYAFDTASLVREWLDTNVTTWPTDEVDGFWVDFHADAPSSWGAYDTPFGTMDDALDVTTDGTKLHFQPGSSGSWAGTTTDKMIWDAPEGTVLIGG